MNGLNSDLSLPATTTSQQDLTTAGQRRVNLLWEYTQAIIAIVVTVCTMTAGAYATFNKSETPPVLNISFGMVIGFYFSRTNHAAIGGIGKKPSQDYEGR
jgi:hypothetical protein